VHSILDEVTVGTPESALTDGLDAWRSLAAAQQPGWPDEELLARVTAELATYPPLVFAGECDDLKGKIAAAARGEAFFLQGGDCAETFAEVNADRIRGKIKTMLQMAVVLTYGASMPVIKVGRMAGQYAKPRSKPTEVPPSTTTRSTRSLAGRIRDGCCACTTRAARR
jgi:3-deoxy-7-phosphoheptulonate synthase